MVVPDGLASDSRPQSIEGSGSDGNCLGSPCLQPSALSASLIEPNSDVSLPVLSQMDIGDHVIMLNHWQ